MIVLVTDPGDRCLLARNAAWPPTRVSILAGFVEAGESAEQAVVREVGEEVGIAVGRVRYLGSQPWPMPQSLMLGFRAEAVGDLELRTDDDEITEANWFSRAELGDAIASGTIRLPPPVSIAPPDHPVLVRPGASPAPGSRPADPQRKIRRHFRPRIFHANWRTAGTRGWPWSAAIQR